MTTKTECPDCGRIDCPSVGTHGQRINDDPRTWVDCLRYQLDKAQAEVSTRRHMEVIRNLLDSLCTELLHRGETHDQSKLSEQEAPVFTEYSKRLKGLTYGSQDYQDCLKGMAPALKHHYENNRHHPEHFPEGIEGMNLVDLLEMMVDWYASTMRHDDGDIRRSLEINQERFGISPQLRTILDNTIPLLETLWKGQASS